MDNKRKSFEYHGIGIEKLPFIFHYDVVNTRSSGNNWHKNIEILFFAKGEGHVEAGIDRIDVQKGDIVIFNSNVPHRIESETTVEYYCFIPDSEFCEKNDIDTGSILFETHIQDITANALYQKITEAFSEVGLYRNASIKAAVLNLLVYLAKNHAAHDKERRQSDYIPDGIQLAASYILANISQKFTIDELSEQAGMSKYYFIREFKKFTGDSPIVFINKSRCEIAKRMLASDDYSVVEISEKTGFESCAYFCKIFKKYTGVSPKNYNKPQV